MPISLQSRIGLNAANFFLAEVTGVVLPFLNDFLRSRDWRYDSIGLATAIAGLGVFLMQSPAGFLVDRLPNRRFLLAGSSLLLGLCYGILPLVPARWWSVDPLLFIAGMGQAFFTPLLGALALGLVGHARLSKTMGFNQGWNHAGNIAAAVSAMALVTWIGLSSVFCAVAAVAMLAAASVFIIRPSELDERRASGATDNGEKQPVGYWGLLRDRRIVILFASTALFHLANAPVMPLVALYRRLKDTSWKEQQPFSALEWRTAEVPLKDRKAIKAWVDDLLLTFEKAVIADITNRLVPKPETSGADKADPASEAGKANSASGADKADPASEAPK
jgi:MFS family permease